MHKSKASSKITHHAIALQNIHAFTGNQASDIIDTPSFSLCLSPIEPDCSIVKRRVGQMPNVKGRYLEKSLSSLVHLAFRCPRSPFFGYAKIIQAVIRANGVFFYLILYVPSTIFQLYRDGSSWVKPVLS